MFITLSFYAFKATFRLAIVAIKHQVRGAESKTKTKSQIGKQIQEKLG